jgi:2'-5' RNA ligase
MQVDIGRLAGAGETGVIVPVAAAERAAGRFQRVLDHSAVWGSQAHVTVLYPFVPPDQVDAGTIGRIGAALAEVRAFSCTFSQVKWFGEDIVWLSPEPDRHFRELTRSVWRRFPDYPPYRGEHPDSTPHLTIGRVARANLESMRRAAVEVQAELPITTRIDHARLVAGSDAWNSWRTVAEFTLPG